MPTPLKSIRDRIHSSYQRVVHSSPLIVHLPDASQSQLTHVPKPRYSIANPKALFPMATVSSPSPTPSYSHSNKVLDKAATIGKKVVKEVLKGTGNNTESQLKGEIIHSFGRGGAARPKAHYGSPLPFERHAHLGFSSGRRPKTSISVNVDTSPASPRRRIPSFVDIAAQENASMVSSISFARPGVRSRSYSPSPSDFLSFFTATPRSRSPSPIPAVPRRQRRTTSNPPSTRTGNDSLRVPVSPLNVRKKAPPALDLSFPSPTLDIPPLRPRGRSTTPPRRKARRLPAPPNAPAPNPPTPRASRELPIPPQPYIPPLHPMSQPTPYSNGFFPIPNGGVVNQSAPSQTQVFPQSVRTQTHSLGLLQRSATISTSTSFEFRALTPNPLDPEYLTTNLARMNSLSNTHTTGDISNPTNTSSPTTDRGRPRRPKLVHRSTSLQAHPDSNSGHQSLGTGESEGGEWRRRLPSPPALMPRIPPLSSTPSDLLNLWNLHLGLTGRDTPPLNEGQAFSPPPPARPTRLQSGQPHRSFSLGGVEPISSGVQTQAPSVFSPSVAATGRQTQRPFSPPSPSRPFSPTGAEPSISGPQSLLGHSVAATGRQTSRPLSPTYSAAPTQSLRPFSPASTSRHPNVPGTAYSRSSWGVEQAPPGQSMLFGGGAGGGLYFPAPSTVVGTSELGHGGPDGTAGGEPGMSSQQAVDVLIALANLNIQLAAPLLQDAQRLLMMAGTGGAEALQNLGALFQHVPPPANPDTEAGIETVKTSTQSLAPTQQTPTPPGSPPQPRSNPHRPMESPMSQSVNTHESGPALGTRISTPSSGAFKRMSFPPGLLRPVSGETTPGSHIEKPPPVPSLPNAFRNTSYALPTPPNMDHLNPVPPRPMLARQLSDLTYTDVTVTPRPRSPATPFEYFPPAAPNAIDTRPNTALSHHSLADSTTDTISTRPHSWIAEVRGWDELRGAAGSLGISVENLFGGTSGSGKPVTSSAKCMSTSTLASTCTTSEEVRPFVVTAFDRRDSVSSYASTETSGTVPPATSAVKMQSGFLGTDPNAGAGERRNANRTSLSTFSPRRPGVRTMRVENWTPRNSLDR